MLKNLLLLFIITAFCTSIQAQTSSDCVPYMIKNSFDEAEIKGDELFARMRLDSALFKLESAKSQADPYKICSDTRGLFYERVANKITAIKAMKNGIAKMNRCEYDSAQIYFKKVAGFNKSEKTTNVFQLSRALYKAKLLRDLAKPREALDSLKNIDRLADTLSICIKNFKVDLEKEVSRLDSALESAKAAYNTGDFDKAAERIALVKTETPEVTALRQKIEGAKQVRLLISQNNYVEALRLLNTLPTDDRLALERQDLEAKKTAYIKRQLESIKPLVEASKFAEAKAVIDTTYKYTGANGLENEKTKLTALENTIAKLDAMNFTKDCSFNFSNEIPVLEENKDKYKLAEDKLSKVKTLETNPFQYNKHYNAALAFIRARQYTQADTCFSAIEKHCGKNETIQKWKINIAQLRIADDSINAKKVAGAFRILEPLAQIEQLRPSVNILYAKAYLKSGKMQDLTKPVGVMEQSVTRKAYPDDANGKKLYDSDLAKTKQDVQSALINSNVYLCATAGIYSPILQSGKGASFAPPTTQLAGYPVYYGGRLHFHGNRVANFYVEGRYEQIGVQITEPLTDIKTTYNHTFLEIPAVLNLHTTGTYKKGAISAKPYKTFYFCFPIGVVGRMQLNKDASAKDVMPTEFAAGGTGGLGLEFAGDGGYFGLQGMFTQYLMPNYIHNSATYAYSYWNVSMTVGFRL